MREALSTRVSRGCKVCTAGLAITAMVIAPSGAASAKGVRHAGLGNLTKAHAADGAYVVSETQVDSSMWDLMIDSPAYGGDLPVRLVLPADWYAKPAATWPTLFMLHGADDSHGYTSWTYYTDFESFMQGKDVLSVLPTEGLPGFSTNYINHGPQYATFTAVELPQILKGGYRSNGVSAIAGLSSGGASAAALPAQYPGVWKAAASYSGLNDTQYPGLGQLVVDALESVNGLGPNSIWGDPILNVGTWTANNPTALVSKMHDVPLFLSFGNGKPGPLDNPANPTVTVEGGILESAAYTINQAYITAAQASGNPITVDYYGNGTHSWPYWQMAFHTSWPFLAKYLGVPAT